MSPSCLLVVTGPEVCRCKLVNEQTLGTLSHTSPIALRTVTLSSREGLSSYPSPRMVSIWVERFSYREMWPIPG